MAKFLLPSAASAAASLPTSPKLSYYSLLIKAVKNGTYDEIKSVVLSEGADRDYNEKSVSEYNSLVNDALTLAIIFKRYDVLARFNKSFNIDYIQPNSNGNTLSYIIANLSYEVKNKIFLNCPLLKVKTLNYEAHLEQTLFEYHNMELKILALTADYIQKIICPTDVELLLVQNFDPNIQDGAGRTLLMQCASKNLIDACEVVINLRGDVSASDNEDWTPLLYAVTAGNASLIPILVRFGANVNDTAQNSTALMHACSSDNPKIVNTLLDHGAEIDATDNEGNTALMNVLYRPDICKLLLNRRADVTIANKSGKTALMIAQEDECAETYELLLKHIVDLVNVDPIGEEATCASIGHCCCF